MTETTPWDDHQMFSARALALFLGGSEDSFTGRLLALIAKAQPVRQEHAARARAIVRARQEHRWR